MSQLRGYFTLYIAQGKFSIHTTSGLDHVSAFRCYIIIKLQISHLPEHRNISSFQNFLC